MKTTLKIDRLVLHTRGLTPAAARATANTIGLALAEGLKTQATPGKIENLRVTLPAAVAASPAQIARHLAAQISSAPRR